MMIRDIDGMQQINKPSRPNIQTQTAEMQRNRPEYSKQPITLQKSVFERCSIDHRDGLNTAPSVFDKETIFRPSN